MKKDVELRAEGLSLLHPQEDGTSRGLLPFSATFRPGRLHLVEGESGSGKTTLLSLLGLLEAPGEGRVTLGARSFPRPPRRSATSGRGGAASPSVSASSTTCPPSPSGRTSAWRGAISPRGRGSSPTSGSGGGSARAPPSSPPGSSSASPSPWPS